MKIPLLKFRMQKIAACRMSHGDKAASTVTRAPPSRFGVHTQMLGCTQPELSASGRPVKGTLCAAIAARDIFR